MKLIVITAEKICAKESHAINRLFEAGLDRLHIRKPEASSKELMALLKDIHPVYRNRIVLHDHFELAFLYDLRGIHLNKRNPVIPAKAEALSISRSCHSFEEVISAQVFDYVFLSPVFDSISKSGYNQAFSEQELLKAKADGIINKRVVALGGISAPTIPLAAQYGFGGVAVLGSLWKSFEADQDVLALIERFGELKSTCENL